MREAGNKKLAFVNKEDTWVGINIVVSSDNFVIFVADAFKNTHYPNIVVKIKIIVRKRKQS